MSSMKLLTLNVPPQAIRDRRSECAVARVLCLTPVELDGDDLVFKYRRQFDTLLMTRVQRVPVRALKMSLSDVRPLFNTASSVTLFDVIRSEIPVPHVYASDFLEVLCFFKDCDMTEHAFGGLFAEQRDLDIVLSLCPSYRLLCSDTKLYHEMTEFLHDNLVGLVNSVVQYCIDSFEDEDLVEFDTTSEFDAYIDDHRDDDDEYDDDQDDDGPDEDPAYSLLDSVFSWYAVTPSFGSTLKQLGEIVGKLDEVTVWGRTTFGQSVAMDYVCQAAFVYRALMSA